MATTPRGRAEQHERYCEARGRLHQRHQENQRRRKDKRKAAHQIRISPTDFEACLGRDKYDVYRPLYNVQVMADLKTDLILAYTVSPSATDSGQLIPLIDLTKAVTGRRRDCSMNHSLAAHFVWARVTGSNSRERS